MDIINYIIWSPQPNVIPGLDVPRWYGLLFALGFIISQQIFYWIYKQEGLSTKYVDKITIYMVVATVIGARLGHCLFYDPWYYLSNPLEILMIWKGGLASHGGAIGILIALYLYSKKYPDQKFLWILDRMVIVVCLTGALIRLGNFFNSEMEGIETNSSTGVVYAYATEQVLKYDDDKVKEVVFEKGGKNDTKRSGREPITINIIYHDDVELDLNYEKRFYEFNIKQALTTYQEVVEHISIPVNKPLNYEISQQNGQWIGKIYATGIVRHAAQLYETGYCLLLMFVLFFLWLKKRDKLPLGFNFSLFMIVLWGLRFVDEFFKMNQEPFEADIPLNMGQWLSIPMVIVGMSLMVYVFKKHKKSN